jgi:hypothetical protein
MNLTAIVRSIDEEIVRLEKIRALPVTPLWSYLQLLLVSSVA